jgi:hypothetical protein
MSLDQNSAEFIATCEMHMRMLTDNKPYRFLKQWLEIPHARLFQLDCEHNIIVNVGMA